MVDLDLVDAWRHLRGADAQRFTYFSYRFNCRAKNLGWRLDYFAVPRAMVEQGRLVECMVREEAYGASDHVPLVLVVRKGKAAVAK